MAVVDYFLKLQGVAGESQDDKHKGEIEIDSFSFGLTQTGSFATGGGGGAGKVTFRDLSITKKVDKASPVLLRACATGEHLKEAVITVRKAGGENRSDDFLKITLTDVLVSSYQASGQKPPPPPPSNTIANAADTTSIVGPDVPQDGVALRYRAAKQTVGPVQHITLLPAITGNLLFDPATQKFTVVETPNGILTVGRTAGAVNRGVQEYDVAILIGLLTNPFGTANLHLKVNEVREAAINPGVASAASVSAGAEPHLSTFDVILYTPADGTLTVEDLTRPGRRVGTLLVDPSGPVSSLDLDLTRFVTRGNLAQFGIRIQLRGASLPELNDDKDEEGDHDKNEGDGANNDRAHADGENDNKNQEHDDDKKRTPPSDVSASFTADLVFESA